MKQTPSRADRRRQARDSKQPEARNRMRGVYIAAGLLLAAMFVLVGAMRWNEQRRLALAYATPSPNTKVDSHTIQLYDGMVIGKPGLLARTESSGSGAPIDGVACDRGMTTNGEFLHVHSHVTLFVRGQQMQIPAHIGFVPTAAGGCLYWLHTHDASGMIHVESPHITAPGGGHYTLGMFFHIWGEVLSQNRAGPYVGRLTAFLNGAQFRGDPNQIPLSAHEQITLEIGKPVVMPPNYAFPPNE